MTQSGQRARVSQQDVAGRKDAADGGVRPRSSDKDVPAEADVPDVDGSERRRLRAAILQARSARLQLPPSAIVLRRARAARSA